MITIACTKKLFELSSFVEEKEIEVSDDLYNWHANVFRTAKKNNLIVMNDKTRYCFILFGVKKEHFKKIKEIFIHALIENLRAEEISEAEINEYIKKIDEIRFIKTHDRSVIGSMVDMVKMTEFLVEDYLPIHEMNIIELNRENNQTPIVKLKNFPNRLMKEALRRGKEVE
jgi:hypothetical protein